MLKTKYGTILFRLVTKQKSSEKLLELSEFSLRLFSLPPSLALMQGKRMMRLHCQTD